MQKEMVQHNKRKKISMQWACQLIASLSWMVSVFVYGSFEPGDYLQLLAASAWTVANFLELKS